MKNELLVFVAVGIFFGYFMLGFVKNTEGTGDDTVTININSNTDSSLIGKNIIGQTTINLGTTTEAKQGEVWKNSSFHSEFMELFPDFSAMRDFVKDRVLGDDFQKKLIDKIDSVEDDFYSGKIGRDVAIKNLDDL
jgi:hypothetical protein